MRVTVNTLLAIGIGVAGALSLAMPGSKVIGAELGLPGYTGYARSSVPGCPLIVWQLVAHPDGAVTGIAYYADLSGLSTITGNLTTGGQFHLVAKSDMGNGPVGTVDGSRSDQAGTEADMKGEGCANMHLKLEPVPDMRSWQPITH